MCLEDFRSLITIGTKMIAFAEKNEVDLGLPRVRDHLKKLESY